MTKMSQAMEKTFTKPQQVLQKQPLADIAGPQSFAPPTRLPPPAPFAPAKAAIEEVSPHTNRLHKPYNFSNDHTPVTHPANRRVSESREISPPSSNGTRPRHNSLLPPSTQSDYGHPRNVSSPNTAPRRGSGYYSDGEEENTKATRRKSWIPIVGRKSRPASGNMASISSNAWIEIPEGAPLEYSLAALQNRAPIAELWNEHPTANLLVYFYPQSAGMQPQIKTSMRCVQGSPLLRDTIFDAATPSVKARARAKSFDGRRSLTVEDATRDLAIRGMGTPPDTPKPGPSEPQSASDSSADSIRSFPPSNPGVANDLFNAVNTPRLLHLYLDLGLPTSGPFSQEDMDRMVEMRNFFGFFDGQLLVSTPKFSTAYHVFLSIAALLKKYEYIDDDGTGTSYGEDAYRSFSYYVQSMKLSIVRESTEKIGQALILGECMRHRELYSTAFAHAASKNFEIRNSLHYQHMTGATQSMLNKSALDLQKKKDRAEERLRAFEYPSIFAGIGSSTTAPESKIVRFARWDKHFKLMRDHVLTYYKKAYGSWPPKGSSKKNDFVEGGLNRLVLRALYADMCALYDYMADQHSLTTRGIDEGDDQINDIGPISPVAAALRKLLGEFDRSAPPNCPPIPFDVPIIPSIQIIDASYDRAGPAAQHKMDTRKLHQHEITLILRKSFNMGVVQNNPFLESFAVFQEKQARSKTAMELSEMRIGHWIFLYAVIQSLPQLVTDSPYIVDEGLYLDHAEEFLCQVPMPNVPWIADDERHWFSALKGVTSLPSHQVNHGVEAIYERSHCWQRAREWTAVPVPVEEFEVRGLSPLDPPPGLAGGELGLRPSVRRRSRASSATGIDNVLNAPDSRSRSRMSRHSMALGLEKLPIGPGEPDWTENSRPMSTVSRASSPYSGSGRPSSRTRSRPQSRAGGTPPVIAEPQNTEHTFESFLPAEMTQTKKKKSSFFRS